ncbi:WD40 repeat-like protein [Annulohypoxylon truncatum]|uniref:WD40 repeat-like protein n=1 Tax=Annulohypoxylon truncatum TaxID=327061 RepID=UPI002008C98E|nr:WD40 repeat-like protein [Annulohypoxylon truncatum]KAI1207640.1 WD40 repeat-like protein [Annulohypoxylon truncatum]
MADSTIGSSFVGAGIQHSGQGNFNVNGNVAVGVSKNNSLADLRLTDPRDDKKRIEQTKGGLLRESYRWILDHHDFLRWRNNFDSRLLWIKGDPGKGKTMLLCGIIDEMIQHFPDFNTMDEIKEEPSSPDCLLSFFFCQATDDRLNNAKGVLRGLIYLLVKQQPSLERHIQTKYEHTGKTLFEDVNAWVALSGIFTKILEDPMLPTTILVIDALDELDEREAHLTQLLNLIMNTPPESKVKWLLSSRNKIEIEEKLKTDQSRARLSLELKSNADHVSHAVNAYIDHCISEIPALQKQLNLQVYVRDQMRQKAHGTFLWVGLVVQELKKARSFQIKPIINAVPTGLVELYSRMIRQIQGLEYGTPAYCQQVLSTITTTYRPLYLEELAALSGLPEDEFGKEGTEALVEIVKLCGSFLTIQEGRIFIIHQSAQDFLCERAKDVIFPRGIEAAHYDMFSRSIQIMSQTLRRNVYNLDDWGISTKNIIRPRPDPLGATQYSCIHWVDHFTVSQPEGRPQHDAFLGYSLADTFLKKHYLHWLEALSILQNVSQGISAMVKLNTLIPNSFKQYSEFAKDATRFVRHNKLAIESSPLQVYTSALVFSPSQSIIRRHFQGDEPDWLLVKPAVEDEWGACIATFEGHCAPINAMAFSPDGTLLASDSKNGTEKIWDIVTGTDTTPLLCERKEFVSLDFSPDGRLSLTYHNYYINIRELGRIDQVRFTAYSLIFTAYSLIWRAKTIEKLYTEIKTREATLQGHTDIITSITFTPDSGKLAFNSHHGTIKVWDSRTGMCVATITGHMATVTSLAFSPNEKQLASGSHDGAIKVWDLGTSMCVTTITGHMATVTSLAFSPNGRQLASGSLEGTIKLWDITMDMSATQSEDYMNKTSRIVFSPDGSQLVLGDRDTFKLLDAATDRCIATLKGYGDCTSPILVFSPDGGRIALYADNAVNILDTATGTCIRVSDGYYDVSTMCFSSDGGRLAISSGWNRSGSIVSTIKVLDIATNTCVTTLKCEWIRIDQMVFSPDESRLALRLSNIVEVWNITTNRYITTFTTQSIRNPSMAFSTDMCRVVLATENVFYVCDITTGSTSKFSNGRTPISSAIFLADKYYPRTDANAIALHPFLDIDRISGAFRQLNTYYNLKIEGEWIVYNGQNLLWLPFDYRCAQDQNEDESYQYIHWDTSAQTIRVHCKSGRIWVLTLQTENLMAGWPAILPEPSS